MEGSVKMKKQFCSIKLVMWLGSLLLISVVFHVQSSLDYFSYPNLTSKAFLILPPWKGEATPANAEVDKLRASVTFLPLKDLRFSKTPMAGNTWFMSSLNDTVEANEAEHLYFPSEASQGRLLCLRGRDTVDGAKNSYALAWRDSLPDSTVLIGGLTFVSDTYYDHLNLWHGISAALPFVRWSMKNGCSRPRRWVLFHWGEMRFQMGSWLEQLLRVYFGDVEVERFDVGVGVGEGEGPYCFEKALVIRHDTGAMGLENKLKVFDSLRCKARSFCGFNQRRKNVNERGSPVIRLTLLMRRGSRSFKNATAVTEIFAEECGRVEGCVLSVVQSEDLSFCDQVRVMSNTDIVASPHGAQLTNMFFMDRDSSVMEFFPKGWLEYAGAGQYAHHWMAHQTGMKHQGAWWDPVGVGEDCPNPKDALQCFLFHKEGQVGHNATRFAQWAKEVLSEVGHNKLLALEATKYQAKQEELVSDTCARC